MPGEALNSPLRVALFTDSFQEANGVATLSRQFAAFAAARRLPFLNVRAGARTGAAQDASVSALELKRGFLSFPLDSDLHCDPLLNRYKNWVTRQLRAFQPDLIHITGPGDFGILGFWAAHSLRVPLVASWHTNLHEYAGRRLDKLFARFPRSWRTRIAATGEALGLNALLRFYRLPRFLMAPNESTVRFLEERTGKPSFLMPHGVDTDLFSPTRRSPSTGTFRIGYVGRLTPEKNVRLFAALERALVAKGVRDFRLLLVGDGGEREWLRRNLQFADLPGVLRGPALAAAFASMDAFVFPSLTDTFGLVLLEAMASGVPVVAGPEAGGRAGVRHGVTGFHAPDTAAFVQAVLHLMENEPMRLEMSRAARRFACLHGWSGVFDTVYETYESGLAACGLAPHPFHAHA